MLYGKWMLGNKSQQENKLNIEKMRMLWWMSGPTRQDRIKNGGEEPSLCSGGAEAMDDEP